MAVKFTDIHDKMYQRCTNLITEEQFFDWINENIKIKTYIPISTKAATVQVFSDNFNEEVSKSSEDSLSYVHMIYDVFLVFEILFSYLDIFVLAKFKSTTNYDLIIESGLYDYILSYCEKDYNRFVDICNRATNINDVNIIRQISSLFVEPPKPEEFEKLKDIINNIDKDKIEILDTVNEYNNSKYKEMSDKLKEKELKKAKQEIQIVK